MLMKKKGEKKLAPSACIVSHNAVANSHSLTEVMDPAIGTQIVVASGDAGIVGQDGPRVP